MELVINDPITAESPEWTQGYFRFGDQKRVAMVTYCKFIGSDRIIVAHRAQAKLYLLNYDLLIIDSINIKYDNKFYHPDTICVNNDMIYMVAYTKYIGIAQVKNDKIILIKNIRIEGDKYHGIYYENNKLYLGQVINNHIVEYNLLTNTIKKYNTEIQCRIKSLTKINDLFICGIDKKQSHKDIIFDSNVVLFKLENNNLIKVDQIELIKHQLDGMCKSGDTYVFCVHNGNDKAGYLYYYKLVENKIIFNKKTKTRDFPHGIDINNNKLIYVCYGSSSIKYEEHAI